jgi:putative membrane protein
VSDETAQSPPTGEPTPAPTPDTATRLALQRTDLAIERTYWAAERTLMGWIRTALAMISFGFTLGKISQVLQDVTVKGPLREHTLSVETVAYFLVVLGTAALVAAAVQYAARVHELRRQGLPRHVSIAFVVSVVLSLVGGLVFTALVLNL